MGRVVDYARLNSGIRNNFTGIEFTHSHSYREHIHKCPVNFTFGEYSLLHGFQGTCLVNASAVGIDTCFNSKCCCFFIAFGISMASYHIVNCTTVSGYITIKSISFAGDSINQKFACRDRYSVYGAVGCHDCRKLSFPDKGSVWCKIKFAHIAVVHVCTAGVAVKLGIVCKIMFSAGNSFQVGRIVAHQSLNKTLSDPGNKERVFTESFGSSSPARITGWFNDRRPVGKCKNNVMIKPPGLVGNHFCFAFDQLRVPGSANSHTVRERSGRHAAVVVSAHYSMQRFAPDIIMIHSQTGNGRHCISQLALFFLGRHSRNKVGSPFFK